MSASLPLPPLSRLYRESFDDVWVALRRLGVPAASLEDAVHDVFVVAQRRSESFEGRSGARAWLLGIARRIAFRHRRTQARTLRRHRALAAVPPVAVDAHEQIARREAWLALQRFLDELDRPQREAFVLGELERLSRRELGVALGVSPNTAYSRLRAARARFSEVFAEGRPSPHTVLAIGRDREAPPDEARARVWLALGSGLGGATSSAGSAGGTAAAIKAVLATVGLASVVLGVVATVSPGLHEGSRSPVTHPQPAQMRPSSGTASARPAVEPAPRASSTHATPYPPASTGASSSSRPLEPAARRASAPPEATTSTAMPTAASLSAEATLLRTAKAALARAHAAAALDALHEHQRRFPDGVLAEERDASIIRAECALGRSALAHDHARRFVAAHPRSAYLEALAQSCVAAVTNPTVAGD